MDFIVKLFLISDLPIVLSTWIITRQFRLNQRLFRLSAEQSHINVLSFLAGPFVIVWKRGTTLLSAGPQIISMDPRISLIGYNLQLKDIRHADQGDYTCQIGDGTQGDLIHTIEILSEYNFNKQMSTRSYAQRHQTVAV